ncbi:hypothetical protein HNR07_003103 [Nocardiopsis metallicus]|uniref:Uncharacterized protein n=1 Tax=Nocardiopsis metallicus TaxID=179819 RepID=A0A840WK26_9ACTN|nr:hypothetical protein [Nocardiopsis metallicus]
MEALACTGFGGAVFPDSQATVLGFLFSRTHAVALGHLSKIQAARGETEAACATRSETLDAMQGVSSGQALNTLRTMRTRLNTFRGRTVTAVREVDLHASQILCDVP